MLDGKWKKEERKNCKTQTISSVKSCEKYNMGVSHLKHNIPRHSNGGHEDQGFQTTFKKFYNTRQAISDQSVQYIILEDTNCPNTEHNPTLKIIQKLSETTKNLLKKNELCGGINISHSCPNRDSAYIISDYWNVHNYKISLLS